MTAQPDVVMIDRIPTGTAGLDHILRGGMPLGRTTLVSGTAGSGKTVLGLQIHELAIDSSGMHIVAPFSDVTGIRAGNPRHAPASELDDLASSFGQPDL